MSSNRKRQHFLSMVDTSNFILRQLARVIEDDVNSSQICHVEDISELLECPFDLVFISMDIRVFDLVFK